MCSSILLLLVLLETLFIFVFLFFLFGPRCWFPLLAAWLVVFRSGLGSAVARGRFGGEWRTLTGAGGGLGTGRRTDGSRSAIIGSVV